MTRFTGLPNQVQQVFESQKMRSQSVACFCAYDIFQLISDAAAMNVVIALVDWELVSPKFVELI